MKTTRSSLVPRSADRPRRTIAAGILGLGAIIGAALVWGVPHIESDLTARSLTVLEQSQTVAPQGDGVVPLSVRFNGTTAELHGTAADDASVDAAIAAVEGIGGVHRVLDRTDRLPSDRDTSTPAEELASPPATGSAAPTTAPSPTTAPATTAPQSETSAAASLMATFGLGGTTIVGSVATDDQRTSLAAEAFSFSGEADVGAVDVSASTESEADLEAFAQLISVLADNSVEGSATLEAGATSVVAVAKSDAARAFIERQIETTSTSAGTDVSLTTAALAPAEQERLLQAELNAIVTLARVAEASATEFEYDRADLDDSDVALLTTISEAFARYGAPRVAIIGHTDSDGDASENLALGGLRATAVAEFLIERGVDADRLVIESAGEGAPSASNETPAGRQTNRRAEFSVIADPIQSPPADTSESSGV